MKPKLLLSIAAAFFISLIIFAVSCKKEHSGDNNSSQDSTTLSVLSARKFFYKTLRKTPINNLQIQSTDDKAKAKLYPYWYKAISSTTDKYSFVEVPITSAKKSFILYSFTGKDEPKRVPNRSVLDVSFKRLIIYRNKLGAINERIITYIPDREYLTKHQNDASHNHINQLDKDFSGYLEYSNWDQKRLFVLRIVNGVSVKRIDLRSMVRHLNSDPVINSTTANNLKTNETCTEYCEPEYFTTCVDVPDDPNVQETCTDEIVGYDCYEDCSGSDPDPCSDPANFNTAECGGDEDPDPPECRNCTPPPPPTDPCSPAKLNASSNANNTVNSNNVPNLTDRINATLAIGNLPGNDASGNPKAKEATFNIEKDPTTSTYTATQPSVTVTPDGATGSVSFPDNNTVYTVHGHTLDNGVQPSPQDIWAAGLTNKNHSNVLGDITIGNEGSYLIAVTDATAFTTFNTSYPKSDYVNSNGDWIASTSLSTRLNGVEASAYYGYLLTNNITAPTPAQIRDAGNYAIDAKLSYFLGVYNTGLTLLKKGSDGNYKALHFTISVDSDGNQKISVSPCN